MRACSLAHEGVTNPSLSRIQIAQSSFKPFPEDIDIHLCRQCIEACPFEPARIIWNSDRSVCVKCDLCLHAPYWGEQGGPGGKQACVEVCPMRALAVTTKVPRQKGDEGYRVNLRNEHWEWLGFMTDQTATTERQR